MRTFLIVFNISVPSTYCTYFVLHEKKFFFFLINKMSNQICLKTETFDHLVSLALQNCHSKRSVIKENYQSDSVSAIAGAGCAGTKCKIFYNGSLDPVKIKIAYKDGENCQIKSGIISSSVPTTNGTLEFTIPGQSQTTGNNANVQCISAVANEFWYELTKDTPIDIVNAEKNKLQTQKEDLQETLQKLQKTLQKLQTFQKASIKDQIFLNYLKKQIIDINSQIVEIDNQLNGISPIMKFYNIKTETGYDISVNWTFSIKNGKVTAFPSGTQY